MPEAAAGRYAPRAPFLSGAVAGGLEILLTFPLEFVKTEQQLQAAEGGHAQRHLSMRETVQATVRQHGLRGLYRGLPPWLFFAFPRSAVRFSVFENSLTVVSGVFAEPVDKDAMTAVCGLLAGTMEAATVMTPMQNVQIKLMHDAHRAPGERRYPSFFRSLYQIPMDFGLWKGLFAGMMPTVLKGAVNNMIRFSIYERMKTTLAHLVGVQDSSATAVHLLAGAIAGGVSAYVTHPIDTVKAHMMSLHGPSYTSSWDCFSRVYTEGGIPALYRGITPRVTRVCIEVCAF